MGLLALLDKIIRWFFWIMTAASLVVLINSFINIKHPIFDVVCRDLNTSVSTEATTECFVIPRTTFVKSFDATVAMSCLDLPTGISCQFDKVVGPPYPPVKLTILVDRARVQSGTATWKIAGTSGDLVEIFRIAIEIR